MTATAQRNDGSPPARNTGAWLAAAGLLLAATAGGLNAAAAAADGYADVAPLFAQHCVLCHSGATASAGLRLDSFDAVLQGSARGPVVQAGDPAGSELIRRLKGTSQPRMPLTGPPFLSDPEIARVERWIAGGLQRGAPRQEALPAPPAAARPAPGEPVSYRHVAPILARRCAKCHTDNGLMGPAPEGLRLTSHQATLAAGERARVVPGSPAASELVRRIRGQAHPRMPLDGPPYLSEEEMRLIEDWVAHGARDAQGRPAALPTGARVRLHGTLEHGWRLDGLALQLDRRTRIDKHPAPGDYVEVRGQLDAAGDVRVERLRRR